MASQLFSSSQYQSETKQRSVGTGIHYCQECNNMMTPRAPENPDNGLEFYCAHCRITEQASDNRVYVNVLKRSKEESYIAQKFISDDPTLKRKQLFCRDCDNYNECVIFMAPTLAGEESLSLMAECTVCHRQWKQIGS